MKTGIELIAAERERQVGSEGWTAGHDKNHKQGELAKAAICYAAHACLIPAAGEKLLMDWWPWDSKWWKPTPRDPVRELVKAGALIAAEIDRLQRASSAERSGG